MPALSPTPEPQPRPTPYTYVTWLSKVIAGELHCLYAGWFKSHFRLPGRQDARLDTWASEHALMVHDVAAEFRERGYEVFLEGQNTIRVRGSGGAVLAGTPDLVAIKRDVAVVVECKTGAPKVSDSQQARLYMHLLGRWSTHPARDCRRILGEVRYAAGKGGTLYLPHGAAHGVGGLMKRYMEVFLAPAPPQAAPSRHDCRFCELAGTVCPDAPQVEPEPVAVGWF